MTPQETSTSHLFSVRIRLEEMAGDESEWRGKVQHVLSREAQWFRDWATLIENLLALLPDAGAAGPIEMVMMSPTIYINVKG